jgi:hypothetical protein
MFATIRNRIAQSTIATAFTIGYAVATLEQTGTEAVATTRATGRVLTRRAVKAVRRAYTAATTYTAAAIIACQEAADRHTATYHQVRRYLRTGLRVGRQVLTGYLVLVIGTALLRASVLA